MYKVLEIVTTLVQANHIRPVTAALRLLQPRNVQGSKALSDFICVFDSLDLLPPFPATLRKSRPGLPLWSFGYIECVSLF
jgi:hypothetical protein